MKLTGKLIKQEIITHSPAILTGLGIASLTGAVALAAEAGYKHAEACKDEELTKKEIFKRVWKYYIPSAVGVVSGAICIFGANSITAKRAAALASLYSASEAALQTYKDKVIEKIGEKKEKDIHDAVARKDVEDNLMKQELDKFKPWNNQVLCKEEICGRYFKSSVEEIKAALNSLNHMMLSDNFVTLNDFYYNIGLPNTEAGNMLGWKAEEGLIEPDFTTGLTEEGEPYLVIGFADKPRLNFY